MIRSRLTYQVRVLATHECGWVGVFDVVSLTKNG